MGRIAGLRKPATHKEEFRHERTESLPTAGRARTRASGRFFRRRARG